MRNVYSSTFLIPTVRELVVSVSETDDGTDSEDGRGEVQELARKSLCIIASTFESLIISVG